MDEPRFTSMPRLPGLHLEVENGPVLLGKPIQASVEVGAHELSLQASLHNILGAIRGQTSAREGCLSGIVVAPAVELSIIMESRPTVGLFVTCLVDAQRPAVGFAAVRLLEQAGCDVVVPHGQTCCGQPAWNSGDDASSRTLAQQTIEAFEGLDYVVVPSGSCAGTLVKHYPEMFESDPAWQSRASELAGRTHELMSFLVDVLGTQLPKVSFDQTITYHDSCSGLRELDVKEQPRQLLQASTGVALQEMEDTETCCGFGGTFCVKYPEISERMVDDKLSLASQTGAQVLLGGDLGCLMNLAGRASRLGLPLRFFHTAEVLADMAGGPAIGESHRDDVSPVENDA